MEIILVELAIIRMLYPIGGNAQWQRRLYDSRM